MTIDKTKRWHVVAAHPETDPAGTREIWTVSQDPEWPGWDTDSSCSGYGLRKPVAEFLAAAANEKIERESISG